MKTSAAAVCMIFWSVVTVEADPVFYEPESYTGAWVEISDNADNGCWTNIGETKTYAEDQMSLAGFKITKKPENSASHPFLEDNHIAMWVNVTASRWDNGLCVGLVETYFVGAMVPANNPYVQLVNPIGFPATWTVWSNENLNTYVLDHIKNWLPKWVEYGNRDVGSKEN